MGCCKDLTQRARRKTEGTEVFLGRGEADGAEEKMFDSFFQERNIWALFAGYGVIDDAVECAEKIHGGKARVFDFPGARVGAVLEQGLEVIDDDVVDQSFAGVWT